MTSPKQVLFNTLEQLLSTDLNRIGNLAGKAAQDPLVGLTAGPDGAIESVTRRGCLASVGAGLSVDVAEGEVMAFNAGASADASLYSVGVVEAQNVAFGAADPNPRIDVVYATIAAVDSDSTVRNVLVLPARTVSPTAIDKTRQGEATLSVAAGTASPTPVVPAVPAGAIPLWAVYIPASAAGLLDDHLLDYRRYWTGSFDAFDMNARVTGGWVRNSPTSTTRVSIETGQLIINGLPIHLTDRTVDELVADLVQFGTTFDPATEYDFYFVPKGVGTPVSKNAPNGIVLAAARRQDGAPLFNGAPPALIDYGPIQNAPTNPVAKSVFRHNTVRALYVGSIGTAVGAANLQSSAPPLDLQGSAFASMIQSFDGALPWSNGWIRSGRFEYVSATEVRLTANKGIILSGDAMNSISTTFDITTDIASGEAAEAASTWYYCYLRKDPSNIGGANPYASPVRNTVPIISTEAPNANGNKPTPETNFSSLEYLYVGCFFNDASSDVRAFVREGNHYLWKDSFTATGSPFTLTGAKSTITLNLPATSRAAKVLFAHTIDAAAAGVYSATARIYSETGRAAFRHSLTTTGGVAGGAAEVAIETIEAEVLVDGSFQCEADVTALTNVGGSNTSLAVNEIGFVEDPLGIAA